MSFNNLVWLHCSKTDFSSPCTVQTAVNLAILLFNRGAQSFVPLLNRLGGIPGPHCATHFRKCDTVRIQYATRRRSAVEKKWKKAKRRREALAREQVLRREGGPSYDPGGAEV